MDALDKILHYFNENNFPFPLDSTFIEFSERLLGIVKWEWNYDECETFQKNVVHYIKKFPQEKVFIFCNHSPLFTLGSGLQKNKGSVLPNLIEFDERQVKLLQIPLYKIKRGGGLTYHHTGQWIFYPIMKLGINDWGLSKHFDFLILKTTEVLTTLFHKEFIPQRENAGIWYQNKKIASVGIGVEQFTTIHGLALNLYPNETIKKELTHIHPCGLPPQTYSSIFETFKDEKEQSDWGYPKLIHSFHREFVRNISKDSTFL